MEDSNTNQATSQSPIINSPSPTGRRGGGPRTAEGKRRSCQNAHKHGLYTDESFLEGAALELGEDPRQFQRLLKGLIEARRPVGALELAVIEDIALLLLKKGRVDKAELAVQVSNLHQHDLDRRKQMIQVGHANSEASQWDVREHGLRRAISSPGQYEQVLNLLGGLLAMIDFNEFDRMKEAMRTLYGTEHTLRGAEMDTLRVQALPDQARGRELPAGQEGHHAFGGGRVRGGGAGVRDLPARARDEHAVGAGGGDGALARAVGGHHPPAELAEPATGTQDPLADGVAAGAEERSRGGLRTALTRGGAPARAGT